MRRLPYFTYTSALIFAIGLSGLLFLNLEQVAKTQPLFGSTPVLVYKYSFPVFNADNSPTNIKVEYILNNKSKSCLARVTESVLTSIPDDVATTSTPNVAASPMRVAASPDNPSPNTATMTDKVYYLDVNNANCK